MQDQKVFWAFLGLSAIYLANVTVLFGVPIQFGILWSLAVEEHFYLFWPVIVRNVSRRGVGVFAVVIAAAAAFARILTWRLGYDYFAHYTWLVADGLALGSLLAVLLRRPLGNRRGLRLILLGAPAGAIALLGLDIPFHRPLAGGALHISALNLACSATVAGSSERSAMASTSSTC